MSEIYVTPNINKTAPNTLVNFKKLEEEKKNVAR